MLGPPYVDEQGRVLHQAETYATTVASARRHRGGPLMMTEQRATHVCVAIWIEELQSVELETAIQIITIECR